MVKSKKHMSKILMAGALSLAIMASIPLPAHAANVTFKCPTATYTFNSSSTTNWVGYNYLESGTFVSIAQAATNYAGYSVGTVDGYYGATTCDGIKSLQRAYYLTEDGIVGTNTWNKLYNLSGWYGTSGAVLNF